MLQKSIILFFISLPLLLSAQNKDTANVTWRPINLVVNNSFELSVDAAKPLTKVEPVPKALGWSIPNKSQPLIYSTNEKGFIHDPNGTDWKFKARSGKNVVGLNIIGIKRDYVQGTLENPLEVGKKYYFAFWVHYHCSGANNIGIAFLPEKINVYVTTRLPLKPATYQKKVVPYSNSPQSSWVLVRDSFTAYQPFQNFVIGNFFEDEQTEVERTKFEHYFAYIDDVAVWEAREQPKISTETQTEKDNWQHNSDLVAKVKKNPQPNRTEPQPPIKKDDWQSNTVIVMPKNVVFTLEDVFFAYNSAALEPRSSEILDILVGKLNADKTIHIHIMGHTSSEGDDDLNQKLSDKRAAAVLEYLTKQGIDRTRLSSEGLGKKLPIATNETEEGRKTNRRVTFERVQ